MVAYVLEEPTPSRDGGACGAGTGGAATVVMVRKRIRMNVSRMGGRPGVMGGEESRGREEGRRVRR